MNSKDDVSPPLTRLNDVCPYCVQVCVAYRKLGKSWIVDSASERVLLELQQLDHQTSQGLTGGRVILDMLQQHNTFRNSQTHCRHVHLHLLNIL